MEQPIVRAPPGSWVPLDTPSNDQCLLPGDWGSSSSNRPERALVRQAPPGSSVPLDLLGPPPTGRSAQGDDARSIDEIIANMEFHQSSPPSSRLKRPFGMGRSQSSRTASQRTCRLQCLCTWTTYLVDPRRWLHKYILHFLICCFIPGPYIHDSLLGAYKPQERAWLGIDNGQFGLLFSIASLTGVVCAPGAEFISRLGHLKSALCAGCFCFLGSALTVSGFESHAFHVMLAGRFIFWTSLYLLLVLQTVICFALFTGKQLQVAYAFMIFACRTGGVLGYFFSGPLLAFFKDVKSKSPVVWALWTSVMLVGGSFIATVLFAFFHSGTGTAQLVRPLLSRRAGTYGEDSSTHNSFSLDAVRRLPRSMWFLLASMGCLYGSVFPFECIGADLLQEEYGFTAVNAGFGISLCPMVSLFSPMMSATISGTVIAKCRLHSAGLLILSLGHMSLAFHGPGAPLGCVILLGIGFMLSSALSWTIIPAVLGPSGQHLEAASVGMGYVSLSLVMFVVNYAVGKLRDAFSYRVVELFLSVLTLAGMMCSFVVVRAAGEGKLWEEGGEDQELQGGASWLADESIQDLDQGVEVHGSWVDCTTLQEQGIQLAAGTLGTHIQIDNNYIPPPVMQVPPPGG